MHLTDVERGFLTTLKENYCSDAKKQCAIFKVNELINNGKVNYSEKEIKSIIMTLFDKGLLEGFKAPEDDLEDIPFIPYDLDLTVSLKDL